MYMDASLFFLTLFFSPRQELVVQQLPIAQFGEKPIVGDIPSFPNLRLLDLRDNSKLKSIQIQAPLLKYLRVDACPQLVTVQVRVRLFVCLFAFCCCREYVVEYKWLVFRSFMFFCSIE